MRFISLRKLNMASSVLATALVISMGSLAISTFAPPASAQGAAGVARAIAFVGKTTIGVIGNIFANDNAKREAFTQEFVNQANQKYPNYNVVISHNGGSVEGNNVTHEHLELGMTVGTCGYEAYLSPKGQHFKFVRSGDGGFINWAYGGEFNRDGSTITAN